MQHVAGDAVLLQHHGDGLPVSKVGSPWPPLSV
jgi:hypothetical protein